MLPLARRVFVGTWRTGASPVEPFKQALQYAFSCGVPVVPPPARFRKSK